jgi:hypothetical protein
MAKEENINITVPLLTTPRVKLLGIYDIKKRMRTVQYVSVHFFKILMGRNPYKQISRHYKYLICSSQGVSKNVPAKLLGPSWKQEITLMNWSP